MCDALEILRDVDRHFQRLTGVDMPSHFKKVKKKDALGHVVAEEPVYISTEHYDLWRRVRSAVASLEREGR